LKANEASESTEIAGAFWVYPNGDVLFTRNLLLTVGCNLNFKKLPTDEQMCKIIILSMRENAETLVFGLLDPPVVESTNSVDSAKFHFSNSLEWKVSSLNASTTIARVLDSYKPNSYATFEISLKRASNYYLHFVVIPVIMMVILGWSSFFIDRSSVPARVSMSTLCFLTISNFLSSELKALPRIAIQDAWLLRFMWVSLVFTFLPIVEYVLCNYLYRVEKRLKEVRKLALAVKQRNISTKDSLDDSECYTKLRVNKEDMLAIGVYKFDRLILKKDGSMLVKDEYIEIFSRYSYPISYSIFCIIFYSKL